MDLFPPSRGHLPSHHHCQTLYCRQTDACVFLRTKRKKKEECSNIFGLVALNTGTPEDGNGNDFQTVNTVEKWGGKIYGMHNEMIKNNNMKCFNYCSKRKEWAALRRKTQPQMATRGSHCFAFFLESSPPFASSLLYLFFLQVQFDLN